MPLKAPRLRATAAVFAATALMFSGATAATAEEAADPRWQSAVIGSGAGTGGSITDNGDGTITFDAKTSGTKIATSEDGFQYFYTAVDPASENFTLNATFRVDDASTKDNQSGFGIIAVDDLVAGSSADRYFNSAGAMITRYSTPVGTQDGTPGARFVRGYTGAPNDNTAGARDSSHSQAFDPTYRADAAGPKFLTGDVYELTLRKSNTGFHAIWHQDGQPIEVIEYDPELLLQQNPDTFYVGMAVARKIVVTVTDWDFTTIAPADDEPAQEPPITYVPTNLKVDITATTPEREIALPLVADFHGTGQVLDAAGTVIVDALPLVPGEQALATVPLKPGENRFTARATPGPDQPQLGEREQLESTDPVDTDVTITVQEYGLPGQSLWAAPDGTADGTGTPQNPLDIHTAVAFGQPGQQIVLKTGTYGLTRKLEIDRGRDGTAEQPITLMSEPGGRAVLDLQNSPDGGLVLRGDWWHVYDLEITGSRDKAKPLLIEGHHNVIERVESHHNADSGIQISGSSAEKPAMWPSHNLVLSSESHHNADPGGNDADGFGVKLTVGEGNVLRYNVAHHNIDDGWDLYAKSTTGPIGTVIVEDSVAYENGFLSENPTLRGEGNGFKLGGESIPGDHLLRNSISFGNLGTGATSNSGPDVRLQGVTSVGNDRGIRLETNAKATAYEASGIISWNNPQADVLGLKQADTSLLVAPSNYFNGATADASDGRPAQVGADWFVSTDTSIVPRIAEDGSIDMGGLFEPTDAAPADTGARLASNPSPTTIVLLPAVPGEPGPDAWYPSAAYDDGDLVQHDGVVYEAQWWTRNSEPGAAVKRTPWVEVGPIQARPAVSPCVAGWDAAADYDSGDTVSHGDVTYRAQWWARGAEPGVDLRGSWAAIGACA
ncbi:chitodextrinase [Microbacterium sp. ZKA21]|uniref:carbohydrate-binding protein n=1 Tax=Microbacterium sp. ZKA21 TaxID=3381694 RepID=UPI003D215378